MMKKDELTSRERIRLALNHQETDHVPMDLGGSDWTTITNSATIVVTDIDATFNCTDGTGNGAGWDFGAPATFGGFNTVIGGGICE